jgi:hypothetical protein
MGTGEIIADISYRMVNEGGKLHVVVSMVAQTVGMLTLCSVHILLLGRGPSEPLHDVP